MEPSNAHVYGVKHVLSSTSRTKFRNQNGLSRLLTFSHEHPLMLGRKLGDLFSEHFRDVKGNDKDTSKPEAHRFHLANHSMSPAKKWLFYLTAVDIIYPVNKYVLCMF